MFPELTRDDVFRIETPRLWLRWPVHRDAAQIASFAGLREVAEMTSNWPVGVSVMQVEQRICEMRERNAAGAGLGLVVTLKTDPGKPIGQIGLHKFTGVSPWEKNTEDGSDPDDARLGLGYHLAPEYWGRGLATEAVRAFTTLAFRLAPACVITADIRIINPGSRRVLEKAGFVLAGSETSKCGLRGVVEKENYVLARSTPLLAVA